MNREHSAGDAFQVRDRLLLYLSEMDVDAVLSLELAAECLRRAGSDCDCRAAMDALEGVLAERGRIPPGNETSPPVRCAPALIRSSMLACDLSAGSLSGLATAAARKCLDAARLRSTPWNRM